MKGIENALIPYIKERVVPGESLYKNYRLDFMRYVFAGNFIKNKTVLDIACGASYGSKYLHDCGAREVVGVDISQDVIEYAKKHYRAKNLDFICMDATRLGLEDNIFDVICSFDTIEHINATAFLSEIRKVLKSSGTFIVSTPAKEIHSRYSYKPVNPFHLKEFSQSEFRGILKHWFADVILYGQRFSIISNAYSLFPGGSRIAYFIDLRLLRLLDRFRRGKLEHEAVQTQSIMKGHKDRVMPLRRTSFLKPSSIVAVCRSDRGN